MVAALYDNKQMKEYIFYYIHLFGKVSTFFRLSLTESKLGVSFAHFHPFRFKQKDQIYFDVENSTLEFRNFHF